MDLSIIFTSDQETDNHFIMEVSHLAIQIINKRRRKKYLQPFD